MWQRGDIPTVPLLAEEFVNEGFMHAKPGGNLPFTAELLLHRGCNFNVM